MSDAETLAALKRLATFPKDCVGIPEWTIKTERSNRLALEVICPLAIDGAVEAGLALRMGGPQVVTPDRPFFGFCAHLFSLHERRHWHLGRLEFDPENRLKPHLNRYVKIGVPPRVLGPQQHLFIENEAEGCDAFTPVGNLPTATILVDFPMNFNDILTIVGDRFAIPSLWLEEPPWLRSLL